MKNILRTMMATVLLVMIAPLWAAGMDHSTMDHSQMGHGAEPMSMPMRSRQGMAMPPSGKAREAGGENGYMMVPKDVNSPLHVQCAQARRGLVMLDNASWHRCGGKPNGAARAPSMDRRHAGGDHLEMGH